MAKVMIDPRRCEGARTCLKVCPEQVFGLEVVSPELPLLVRWKVAMHGGKQAVVLNEDRCTACMRCVQTCPEQAITVLAGASAEVGLGP